MTRLAVVLLSLIPLAAPLPAKAQQAGRMPRLCFLTFDPGTAQSPSPRFEGFFRGLRDLGYVHGRRRDDDVDRRRPVVDEGGPGLWVRVKRVLLPNGEAMPLHEEPVYFLRWELVTTARLYDALPADVRRIG